MPLFHYRAITNDGHMEVGSIELPTKEEVLAHLEAMNAIPIAINEGKHRNISPLELIRKLASFRGRSSSIPLMEITNGLGMLLKAGLPLDRAIKSIAIAVKDDKTKQFLSNIEAEIREGHSFSSALEKRVDVVGELYVSMVKAGEVAGRLDESILRLSQHLEHSKELKDNIITAMLYPVILLVVTLISIVILMVMVMPRFKQLFLDMGGEVPAVTQLFLNISDQMSNNGIYILMSLCLLLLIFQSLKRHEAFAVWIDAKSLRIPWYGSLIEKIQMTKFAKTLSLLLKSGVSIQRSLEISQNVIANRFIKEDIKNKAKLLNEGESFSSTIGTRFPLLTQQMVRIGEEASELESTLESIADIAQQDVDRNIKRVLGIVEPVIIVVLGVIVAAVISSIMVAVLSMNDLVVM
jgi:general secretion pathway protein F